MEPEKITAVRDWPTPRSVKEVRSFIGFTNLYRTFIKGYGEIASPLYDLTKKNVPFEWADKCEEAFQTLRHESQSHRYCARQTLTNLLKLRPMHQDLQWEHS